ncbi:tetratricopeptide repeat protein [Megamonas sp.]
MAKRIKFALEMKDGAQVRNLEDLKENFDLEKAIGYFLDGKLMTWLNDRYYEEEAEALENLSKDDEQLNKKLCQILGVEYEDEGLNPEEIERRNERIARLKQYTDNQEFIDNVDLVAFDQEDLADLLDEDEEIIYLCQNKFTIPLRAENKKYIGIGKAEAVIRSKTVVDFAKLNVEFVNISFNADYEKLIKDEQSSILIDDKIEDTPVSSEKLLKEAEQAKMDKNFDKALTLYKKIADTGNAKAMFYMGKIYDNTEYVKYDIQKAINWYKRAADLENAKAMNNLGVIYAHKHNIRKAINWLKKAADLGNIKAMNNLSNIYFSSKNFDKAEKYWQKAADLHDVSAMYNLGYLYKMNNSFFQAFRWYEQAANAGDIDAMKELGDLYRDGLGVNTDKKKAFEWYMKAADNGDENAMNSIGCMYYNGEYVSENEEAAKKWFIAAAKNNHIRAMNNLGWLFKQDKDYAQSLYWYRKSAQRDNAEGIFQLAWAYDFGEGVIQDKRKAFELYKKAAEKGHSSAMANLGYAYRYGEGIEKSYRLAMEWYQKAVDNGNDTFAMRELGHMYETGQNVIQNYVKAFEWYKRAADMGDTYAMYDVGRAYDMAKGVYKDPNQAIYWYERSANEGNNTSAMYNLGCLYKKYEKYSEAIEWYKKAAKLGDKNASKALEKVYHE